MSDRSSGRALGGGPAALPWSAVRDPKQEAAMMAAIEAADWEADRQGLAITFERILIADDAAVASFVVDGSRRMIVGLERAHRDWEALDSTLVGPDSRDFQSFRPSEYRAGHWTIVAAGFAPTPAARASISFAGDQHLVPVIDGLYLFAVGVDREPEFERLLVRFVE
jgi:hypothetical protein